MKNQDEVSFSWSTTFNSGIANKLGVNAAILFQELSFWDGKGERTDGWIYKPYEEMRLRFPYISEFQLRKAWNKLKEVGWIDTKIIKKDGAPTLHYKMLIQLEPKSVSEEIKETMETEEIKETSIYTENNHNRVFSATKKKQVEDLLSSLVAIVNPREKVTESRLRLLNARLKDYTPDEIIASAKAFSKSTWHKENNQMTIDNLLAPSKFGRWYAQRSKYETKDQNEWLKEWAKDGA